ncbi:MAG: hypothetical protein RLZZ416_284 [Candidatus Parcubacteria bacterium]|jgi:NDP-sugar pyrophosphorylase family protein
MQAVILAAGRGTRMNELTAKIPKPMLEIEGKSLLEYKLEAMPDEVAEVILVVGYLGNVIRTHFGESFDGKRIAYVEQKDLNGTGGALWLTKNILKDRFLVMAADDIYAREDLEHCAQGPGWKMLVQQLPEIHRAGSVLLGNDGNIDHIVESSAEDAARLEPGIASTSLFAVDTRLFTCPLVPKFQGSLEYGHPQTIVAAAHQLGIPLEPVFTDQWIQITAPKDLVVAAEILKKIKK